MKKYTVYLGLNDRETKTQKIDSIEAYKIAQNIIMKRTSGLTISQADGIYTHDDGTVVIEKTLRIELLFIDEAEVVDICKTLREVFNQESVIYETTEITSKLVEE